MTALVSGLTCDPRFRWPYSLFGSRHRTSVITKSCSGALPTNGFIICYGSGNVRYIIIIIIIIITPLHIKMSL